MATETAELAYDEGDEVDIPDWLRDACRAADAAPSMDAAGLAATICSTECASVGVATGTPPPRGEFGAARPSPEPSFRWRRPPRAEPMLERVQDTR